MINHMKTPRTLLAALPLLTSFLAAQTAPVTTPPPTAAAVASTGSSAAATVVAATVAPPPQTANVAPPDTTNPRPTPLGSIELPVVAGETSIALDVGFGIRYVPPSRVTVPTGERLRIAAPALPGATYRWTKNGQAIPDAANNVLFIDPVTSGDAGTYLCFYVDTPSPSTTTLPARTSQALILGVGPTDRLMNLSTRGLVTADQGLVSGFVVGGAQPKKLILRAVGPSLALFGVSNPLQRPVLKIYDATGKAYENGYVYPAVVGGPTYESDLAASLAKTGAFPLPAGTADAVVMMPFVPGTYTAQVTSANGASGTVLLELYEVP
jgi:hypothetical protein